MWKNIFPILKAELFDDLNLKDEEGPKGGNLILFNSLVT